MSITEHPEAAGPAEEPYRRTDGPVHLWFELSYANYLVWHRSHMQSMPPEWQQRFTDLAEELDAAYPDGTGVSYEVTTVRSEYVCELTPGEMKFLGISTSDDEDPGDTPQHWLPRLLRWCRRPGRPAGPPEEEPGAWRDTEYYLKDGQGVPGFHRVGVPVPDPVPSYNRGRTYLPPDEEGIAACRAARDERRAAAG